MTSEADGPPSSPGLANQRLARWPLRRVLARALVAMCGAMLLLLGVAQYVDVHWQLKRSSEEQLRAAVESGVGRVWGDGVERAPRGPSRLVLPADWTARARELAVAVGGPRIVATVFSVDGQELASVGGPADVPSIDPRRLFDLREAPDAARGVGWFAHTSHEGWEMLLLPLYGADGQQVGAIGAGIGWHTYGNVLAAVRRDLLGVGLVLFGLAFWLSAHLSRILAAPLERLATTASRFAAGDLDARTGLSSTAPAHDGSKLAQDGATDRSSAGRCEVRSDGTPAETNEIFAVAHRFDEMAARVQEMLRAQQRFVEDASHELRTPLTILAGTADMLAVDPADDVRQRGLATIVREVGTMRRLTDDLLLLARSEKTAPAREAVEVSALLADVREYGELRAGDRVMQMTCEDGLVLSGDRTQLERALRNLVENAVRATVPSGRITMRAGRASAVIEIEVEDDGHGIAEQDLPHVFDRFYRADAARTRKTGGSGLGLPIVRSIVRMHGGVCGIESHVGQGTRIWMKFPDEAT